MKNNFFRLSLAIISLVTMLSLLAACGEETLSNVTNTPGQPATNPTPTATGAATTVTTTTVAATTGAATTSAAVTTTVALPTVTTRPATTAAPTATAAPVPTTAPAATDEPTATPEPVTEEATTAPATTKPAVTTAPPVKATTPVASGPAKLPGKIVFEASGIFVVNPDGTGLKKIANGHSPVFSPDSKRVAFISDDDSAINSVDLNGGALQYHCPTEGHLARIVRWSPSGKYVAVDSLNGDAQGTSEVRLCDMTYKGIGALQTVIRDSSPAKLVFDWSLDEKYILWQSGETAPGYDTIFDLWYSKPEIGIQQWLPVTDREYKTDLAEGKMYVTARISPTNKTVAIVGSKLFFKSTPGYKSSYDNLVLNEFENVDGVAWSPDSTAILVSGVYGNNPGMYLYYFDSKKVVQLTQYISSGYMDWTRK